jgi:hypothetical protein
MLLAIALLSGALHLPAAFPLRQDEVTVRATLSSHTASVGQPIVFTVTVRSKSAEDPLIQMPPLASGLTVVGTSTSTQLEISMPGGRTNIVETEYQLIPTRPGVYTILPATVRIGGKTFQTQRLDLTVGGSAPSRGGVGDDSPIQLHMSITPKSPYVGQQILLRLEAMIPADARFHPLRPPAYNPPAPIGFWIQDLPDPITGEVRVIDGRPFEVQTYQGAYFPLTPGTFTIPPGHLTYELRGGVFFAPESREVASDSLTVVVRPLPDAGRPASFGGAVGVFRTAGGVSHSTIAAGDALTYTLQIEGNGNLKSLPPPPFPKIPDVDVYPPSEDATLSIVNGVVGGTRTFSWVLIPRKPGTIEIPSVAFSWFDPALEKYQTEKSLPVKVTVTPAIAVATAGGDTTLAPFRLRNGSVITAFARSRAFLFAQIIPLIAFGLLLLYRRVRRAKAQGIGAQRAMFNQRIDEIDALARTDPRGFYAAAVRIVDDARAYASSDTARARADAITAQLRARLYAPETPDENVRLADARTVRQFVDELFAQTARRAAHPWRGTPGSAAMIVALIAAPVQAPSTNHFEAGVSGYVSGNYGAAVRELRSHVALHPSDATGWYDLGDAYYRVGDPGSAVWAWLHALEQQPRAADVAHNLNLLNARRAIAQVEHWFPISTAELAWLAALCWWLCIAAAIAYTLRRRKPLMIGALSLGTATALALIMLAARWVGPAAVVPAGHGAPMYAAPTRRTEVKDHLEVGDAAEIVRREGDWILVRTSSLAEGWVRASEVLPL